MPTNIASKIGDGNIYYLGTNRSYDLSTLAPTEYGNFTDGNFICLITELVHYNGVLSNSISYPKIELVGPSVSYIYSPSSRKT